MSAQSQASPARAGGHATLAAYRAGSFLSAFLLFMVQPMASKALLPQFGGSFLVWGACMVFFQASLLLGYLYAHLVQARCGVHRYARLHLLFLLAPVLAYPFELSDTGSTLAGLPLVVGALVGLVRTVGWPFLALATTSLVLQRWLSQSRCPGHGNPYTLYAWSNLGSILGLLAYPFLVEPLLPLAWQDHVWWAGYAVLVALHLACLPSVRRAHGPGEAAARRVPIRDILRWTALSAAPCAALLAVTNVITFDVASVPFLWVLPLCVYLVCFVLTFKQRLWHPPWNRPLFVWLAIIAMLVRLAAGLRLGLPVWLTIPFHLTLLFTLCLECAAALVRSKPEHDGRLTTFYLVMALGGLLGSLIVSWIVPLLSTSLVEYGLAVAGAMAAMTLAPASARAPRPRQRRGTVVGITVLIAAALTAVPWAAQHFAPTGVSANLALAGCALPVALGLRRLAHRPLPLAFALVVTAIAMQWTEPLFAGARDVHRHRNYYGIYKVYTDNGMRYLQHGTTQHGRQYLAGPKRNLPLAYYHPATP